MEKPVSLTPCDMVATTGSAAPTNTIGTVNPEPGLTVLPARVLAALESGDVLLVTRLDRLARSTRDLLNVLATVAERGAGFRSLGDPWADTMSVLAGLAEFERSLIMAHTGEGRSRAMLGV